MASILEVDDNMGHTFIQVNPFPWIDVTCWCRRLHVFLLAGSVNGDGGLVPTCRFSLLVPVGTTPST
jgi:hypothetical protein